MALSARYVFGEKDLRHECDVIELHVLVPKVITSGWVFLHRTGGRNHFINHAVVGFVLMNGIFEPTGENFRGGFAPGHFSLDAEQIGKVVEGVTDIPFGSEKSIDEIGSFARPLVIDEVNELLISRNGSGEVYVNAAGEQKIVQRSVVGKVFLGQFPLDNCVYDLHAGSHYPDFFL